MSLPSFFSVAVREIALFSERYKWNFKCMDSTILLDRSHPAENVGDGPAATVRDGNAQKLTGNTTTHNRYTTRKGLPPIQHNVPQDSQAQAKTLDEATKRTDSFGWTAENMGGWLALRCKTMDRIARVRRKRTIRIPCTETDQKAHSHQQSSKITELKRKATARASHRTTDQIVWRVSGSTSKRLDSNPG